MTDEIDQMNEPKTIDEFKQTSVRCGYDDLYPSLLAMVKATDSRSRSFVADWQSERKDDPKTLIIQEGGRDSAAFARNFRTVRFGLGQRMGHTSMGIYLCEEWAPHASLFLTDAGWVEKRDTPVTVASMWSGGMPTLSRVVSTDLERKLNTFKLIVVDRASKVPQGQLDGLMGFVRPTVSDLGPIYVLLQ